MSVPAVSVEDYLTAEEASQIKHEYVNGQIHAMVGGTLAHNQICMNIASFFRSNTKGSICRTFMSDVKVHIEQNNSFYYPDVLVACGAFDPNSYFVNEPVLIVEVLSPSTSDIDRRVSCVPNTSFCS